MFAAFHEPIGEALRLAAQLLAQLPEGGGINYLRVFVHYVYATQERRTVGDFARTVGAFATERGEQTMSYAEELLREGETKGKIEGEIKGKVETIERLLQAGVAWETIEHATGIDPRKFAEMKRELARLTAASSADSLPSNWATTN